MKAIILAAGKGSRLQCESADLPKALRLLNGKPLIRYVLDGLDFLRPEDITIVVGFLGDQVRRTLGPAYNYVEQTQLDGTAHATLCAQSVVQGYEGPVLVCYCDMPLLRRETYQAMFDAHIQEGVGHTLLAGIVPPPIPPFGRFIRDAEGRLLDIIEDSACTPGQRLIDEVNVGLQVLDGARMWDWLAEVDNQNPKKEYYLTGLVRILAQKNIPQAVVCLQDNNEMLGINTMDDLRAAEQLLASR
jgi:bifunctional N-acetylglucosamine-1-phosphate-uridyltransferase/glucosamine-1-phosphate-acetyltransferase GlmU-like protein